MNSKERVLAAANHKVADRTPITFDATDEVYDLLYKHLQCNSKRELFDRLHVDSWMILPGNFIYSKSEANKDEKTSIWGYKSRTTAYSGGTYEEIFYNPLSGKDSVSHIKEHPWPTRGTLDFSHFSTEAKLHENRAVIGVFTWGAFHIAAVVRGMENLMIDFAAQKHYAHCLIDTIAEKAIMFLEEMLACGDGIDIVYMADDYCSQQGPLFSPETFREFVMPYLTTIVEKVHKCGKKFLLHCCGAVRPLLPMIIDAGVDIVEPLQVRAEGMDPQALKRDFGRDICFWGGVDLQQILCHGTTQDVSNEVTRLIDILGQDGGYVIGPGHTYIQIDAPIENIMTMYETAYAYKCSR